MKSISYTSYSKLTCGACPSDIIICVDPLLTVSGLSGIYGQVVSMDGGLDSKGCQYYIYGLTYEEGQLLDPDTDLTAVLGVLCRGCLTDYFEGLVFSTIGFSPYFDTRNTSIAQNGLNDGIVITGEDDTAAGYGALAVNTTGSSNSAYGSGALSSNISGSDLTAIGKDAGRYITGSVLPNETSSTSVYVGSGTNASADGDIDEIVIGANVTGLGSHTTVIGSGTTTHTALRGNVSVNGTFTPTAQLHLPAGSAVAGTAPIKLTSAPLLAVSEPGTIQYLADAYYGGINTGPSTKEFVFTDGDITGNAGTATALQTPRDINGVSFDGTVNISVPSDIAPGLAGNVMTSTGVVWSSAAPSSSGTVTNVSFTTANGVSAVVTNPTTIPDITVTLGNITPSSVVTGELTATSVTAGYVAKVANYTLTDANYTVECTANSFNITLPTAIGITGRLYNIKNTGAGVITILTTGGQTIDGQASGFWQLNQWSNMQVQSNGANWIIL